jgi:hypothetical protein
MLEYPIRWSFRGNPHAQLFADSEHLADTPAEIIDYPGMDHESKLWRHCCPSFLILHLALEAARTSFFITR